MSQTLINGIISSGREEPLHMSYEEYLERYDEHIHSEWVDGKVVPMAAVSFEHTDVSLFLKLLLRQYVEWRRSGKVCDEPYNMKTGPELPGRSPDILFVSSENLARLKRMYLDGPADLAVEVVSPDSLARDRGEKFREYEQGGVREYWIIDPERRSAEFYVRDDNGVYRMVMPGKDGVYRSAVLEGFWLKVEWLWQRPLPSTLGIAREMGLI